MSASHVETKPQCPKTGSRLRDRWHWALLLICLCFAGYFGLRGSTDTTSPVRSGPVASATAPAQPQTKSIEEIEVGDVVMARDDVTGEVAPKRVVQLFRNTSDHLRILTIRNADGITQEIQTTNEHPFYVPESGWTSAGELTPGTKLLQMDEQLGVVVATRFEEHPEGVPVFNFEVEDYHTYYVADQPTRGPPSGLLAHNKCVPNRKYYGPIHHLATDKDLKKFTPLFEDLFERAGLSMQSPWNRLRIPGHAGPHGQFINGLIYKRLSTAVGERTGKAAQQALIGELKAIRRDIRKNGWDVLFKARASWVDVMGKF